MFSGESYGTYGYNKQDKFVFVGRSAFGTFAWGRNISEHKAWISTDTHFKNNEENIIVECGGYDDEDYSFSIGKVEKVTEEYIEIKYFDYMAKWDEDELDRVYYDDISVVSFGKRYIKYMSKYTH